MARAIVLLALFTWAIYLPGSALSQWWSVAFCVAPSAGAALSSRWIQLRGRSDQGREATSLRKLTRRASQNPYDILGVPRGASQTETRKVFRKMALTEHPDVNPDDPEAAKRFQRLVSAYNAIMGDELMPDELNAIRVQATKAYQEKMNAELNRGGGVMYQGNARLIQGIATVAFFGVLFALGNMDPDTLNSILSPTPSRRF